MKRGLFSTELTCFSLPTFSRRVASAASLACSPEKDNTLHTEESGPNWSPAPLKLAFKGVCVQMPSILTNAHTGPLHIHPLVQFTESIFFCEPLTPLCVLPFIADYFLFLDIAFSKRGAHFSWGPTSYCYLLNRLPQNLMHFLINAIFNGKLKLGFKLALKY